MNSVICLILLAGVFEKSVPFGNHLRKNRLAFSTAPFPYAAYALAQ